MHVDECAATGTRRFIANVEGRRLVIKEFGGEGREKVGQSDNATSNDGKLKSGETILKAADPKGMQSSIVFCRY